MCCNYFPGRARPKDNIPTVYLTISSCEMRQVLLPLLFFCAKPTLLKFPTRRVLKPNLSKCPPQRCISVLNGCEPNTSRFHDLSLLPPLLRQVACPVRAFRHIQLWCLRRHLFHLKKQTKPIHFVIPKKNY